ncbi:GNAT family N-acetyltransferase [Amycolatopsis rhizosphaerae]|uniref:GNAT family N-acetyltransferase n=1 Tax=Amycolatopsis rhizosphaerae TaxID=2053003 RepID=A0A558AW44_9PSEU|nr:GNAT family protein [Amycolatopsis rhizosphaerae]TVT28475.1 GNAT family N-acetyltransferase [Amycolatopsis rhizosphaerae]
MLQPTYPIKTARLILRPFTPDDLAAFHAVYTHPDVTRFLDREPRTRAESAALLAAKVQGTALTRPGQTLAIAIELVETGELIGDLTLHWLDGEAGNGEVAIALHPRHQGSGYAAEALIELMRLGFEDLALHRMFGRCDARNVASASLMEALGLRREAHLRENERIRGEWRDELVYAILATEWRRR